MNNIFLWPVRVYYEDTDTGGVVYYANYLKFFERARTEMLRSKGFEQDQLITEQNVIFAVRAVQVDYIKPARFNELLEVTTEISSVKRVSVNFEQRVTRDQQLLCQGSVRVACLDTVSMKPKAIPEILLQQLI